MPKDITFHQMLNFMEKLQSGKTWEELHEVAALTMQSLTVERFEQQNDPYGVPWEKTARGGNILRDSGRLVQSLTVKSAVSATRESAVVGTNVTYAPVHQFGATIKPKRAKLLHFQVGGQHISKKKVKIPQRAFFPLAERGLPTEYGKVLADKLWNRIQQAAP